MVKERLFLYIIIIGLFTSFYAGLNTLVETDLKKVVALSTLSHLGFICTALFSGSFNLAYLHIISHALFKSLLFISVGEIIYSSNHHQDKRFMGFQGSLNLHSRYLFIFSIFSLLGLPFLRGFYSKDIILESFLYSSTSVFFAFMIYANLFFTYYYTFVIITSLVYPSYIYPFNCTSPQNIFRSIFISLIGLCSVYIVEIYISFRGLSMIIIIPVFNKFSPILFLSFFMFIYYFGFSLFLGIKNYLYYYFGSMLYLSYLSSSLTRKFFYKLSSNLNKSYESGFMYYYTNNGVIDLFHNFSNLFYKFLIYNNFKAVLFFGVVSL